MSFHGLGPILKTDVCNGIILSCFMDDMTTWAFPHHHLSNNYSRGQQEKQAYLTLLDNLLEKVTLVRIYLVGHHNVELTS